jgi:GT2 family glycosyltransferase
VGEEEVFLVAVLEPGEAGGDADHHLLDTAEHPAAQAGVDADPQWGHRLAAEPLNNCLQVPPAEPKVSIIIPNRDGATPRDGLTYLEMVMETLERQSLRDFDVTVVDNGSSDDSIGYLRERWPRVKVVELPENAGFPAAVNRGIEASRGRYVALLNNDIELSPDWLEALARELDEDPGLGFVTGKIMRHDAPDVIEQAGHDFFTCGRFEPRGLDRTDTGQYDEPAPTAIVTAAAAMYRREAVERAGAFDEDYFLYCEDADLCLRLLLAGYRGLYVPGPKAFHVRGGTVGADPDLPRFYLVRNALITLLKDLPASVLLAALPKIALYHWGQLTTARREGFARTVLRAYASFLRALPATLRKRRRVQGSRVMPVPAYRALLRTEYPFPSRLGRLLG